VKYYFIIGNNISNNIVYNGSANNYIDSSDTDFIVYCGGICNGRAFGLDRQRIGKNRANSRKHQAGQFKQRGRQFYLLGLVLFR
jgi:hypothetical protein